MMLQRSIELWSQAAELSPNAPVRSFDLPAATSSTLRPAGPTMAPKPGSGAIFLHRRDSAEPCTSRGPYVHGWWTPPSGTVVFILMNHCKDSSMRSVPTLLALSLLAAGASFANAAHAAEGDDRFAIRLGAMNIDSDNTLRGRTNVAGQDIALDQDFKLAPAVQLLQVRQGSPRDTGPGHFLRRRERAGRQLREG
ncbi:hypothetical protein G6F31_017150 [Rhizopus arrhizus]|nr:hypothetical protein G6F31_017150 [Rhizopus arrhizus]